jgi:putative transposase
LDRDVFLSAEIERVYRENFGVDGTQKIWLQVRHEGITVARCTVECLMNGRDL